MSNPFFDRPILNSPYARPERHWELDADGQPTQKILETRRRAEFITPIPKPKKRKKSSGQEEILFERPAVRPHVYHQRSTRTSERLADPA